MTASNHEMTKKFLILVDGDAAYRGALQLVFTRANFRVRCAPDGITALRMAISDTPDVVLTSADTPRLTGVELCHALREHPRLHDVPVAILVETAGITVGDDRRAADAAACNVLLKPGTTDGLIQAVRRLAEQGRHDHRRCPSACLTVDGAEGAT